MNDKSKCIELRSMTVAELADLLGRSANSLILDLLRQGVVAAKNQMLSEEVVEKVAKSSGFDIVAPAPVKHVLLGKEALGGHDKVERLPVVVVVGHVDHGKTTLLDYIRKSRVAAREKGGITQHLGAYRAHTPQGDIVFIDTPGHAAFPMMRARGITVADIAIVIIAAEDGVMPQTLEAIKRAQLAGIPIIVAINKIDKATDKQIEALKSQLSQHELLPEDWGGQTPCVPISALTGEGVDDLLDVVILQSQVLELTASLNVPASGYVLESHLVKGRGPVATVICQNGILRIGDNFICGDVTGRVSSLKNSAGKSVQSIYPSNPVQVAGFSALPQAGDIFKVASARDVRRGKLVSAVKQAQRIIQVGEGKSIGVIIKTDNASSLEALLGVISKMSGKFYSGIDVLQSGIGGVSESDITFAADTGAIIYGLHTKVESSSAILAQRLGVKIKLFDIIYKLLEDLQEVAEKARPVAMRKEKTGEAVVLKVFDIKKLGVVAGARMTNGSCFRKGTVAIYRHGKLVGEGKITSLQKERTNVKEVKKGFECAFMVEKFVDWQVDDHVDCFIEVPEPQA